MIHQRTQCPFSSSIYYKQAVSDPNDIVEPLGYNFLSQKNVKQIKIKKGALVKKILFDRPIVKQLSNKKTPLVKLAQFLKISDHTRKNTYLSASTLNIANQISANILEQMILTFMPLVSKPSKDALTYVNCFHNINHDNLFNIKDLALSNYLIFYYGSNKVNLAHTMKTFDTEFLQYQIKAFVANQTFHKELINNQANQQTKSADLFGDIFTQQSLHLAQISPTQITNKIKIDEFLVNLQKRCNQIDKMYSGMHLFIGDLIDEFNSYQLMKQQSRNFSYLQFYLYVLTKILGDGQCAIIKIRGTMKHKTTDLISLYKLIFSKVTLNKPLGSNFLSCQKYLVCQSYIKQNGKQIHEYLSEHFHLLQQYGQDKLLVNPQSMFKEDLQTNIMSFNDTIVNKGVKEILEQFLQNGNIQIYPPKQPLIEKLKALQCQTLQELIEQLEEKIPGEEKQQKIQSEKELANDQKEDNQDEQLDIMDFMKLKNQVQKKNIEPQVKKKKPALSQEEEIQKKILEKFKKQEQIRKENQKKKRENSKKGKQKKQEESANVQFGFTSD